MIEGIQFMIDLLTLKKHAEISADIFASNQSYVYQVKELGAYYSRFF
jgi:hypothetical protein